MNEASSSEIRSRDGGTTRHAILDAAASIFADRGFDGASLRDLAEAAGVTRSLIHHHFGSKEELWEAVVNRFFAEYENRQSEILDRPELGIGGFEESARALFGFHEHNPSYVRLHAWANASADASANPQPERRALALRGVERLHEMQARGEVRSDIDPASALIALFNLVEHWFHAHASLEKRLGERLPSDSVFLQDLVRVLIRGIQPCDRDSTHDS